MNEKNIHLAEEYYKAMKSKDLPRIEGYLHPEVHFLSPLAEAKGKEAVLEGIKKFISFFNDLNVRAKFGSENQAVIIYDVDCSEPIGSIRTTALLTFKENLISDIELFFDAGVFTAAKP